ncbi:MAG TPA: DUF1499 domain-containing protein [Gammaproteobacteria bacterium]|nr:DUF1499 domain-containing protein [Gammaproteobacteria bacterium]
MESRPGQRDVLRCLLLAMLSMYSNESFSAQPGRLADCPATPNCVSSVSLDKRNFVASLSYSGGTANAWRVLVDTVLSLPRSKLAVESEGYLHFEISSHIFRFTDDVELLLDAEKKEMQIRSAARSGYSDFGVNRRRVEKIRKLFRQNLYQSRESK